MGGGGCIGVGKYGLTEKVEANIPTSTDGSSTMSSDELTKDIEPTLERFSPSRVHEFRRAAGTSSSECRRLVMLCGPGRLRASSMRHQHDAKVEPEMVTEVAK